MKQRAPALFLAAVPALWLTGCGAPIRPDLPTLVSVEQWNVHNGTGRLRIQYRDNQPGRLSRINCQLEQMAGTHTPLAKNTIDLPLDLTIDPYGTELVDFTLPASGMTQSPDEIPYRLACTLTFDGNKQEKARFHSTLYRMPAEDGLYH